MRRRTVVKALLACALFASSIALAARHVPKAVTENYDWRDGATLALEGRGFPNSSTPYDRLPEKWKGVVPPSVWNLSHTSIDINARFVTDSDEVVVRWEVAKGYRPHPQITLNGTQGVDVYKRVGGAWEHTLAGAPDVETGIGELRVPWTPGAECLVYLPMRVTPQAFSIGVKKGCRFDPGHAHRLAKPVVHYGTSIVHGGRADRAGLTFTSIMARELDVDLVNLGFPGNGRMELSLADVLAEIDAALYIVDCEWNMTVKMVEERYEPFVRKLKELRPETPILLCGGCTEKAVPRPQEVISRKVFDKLKAEDPTKWANLHFLSGVDQLPNSSDCTTDHCHPNVYGFMSMGPVYAKAVRSILGL